MIGSLPPALPFLAGAAIAPLLPRRIRGVFLLALPVLGLWNLLSLPDGPVLETELFGTTLTLVRVDRLSVMFGILFHVGAFVATVFALHVRDRLQHATAAAYVGSALGAVFAGDLVTLLVFWELLALISVFLVFARRERGSFGVGLRYLVPQLASGMLLMAGAALHHAAHGTLAFEKMDAATTAGALLLVAFGVKCAFPGLHTWLTDGYPGATPTGAVFLSGFTTKVAVYALARGFPGTEPLVWIGTAMAVFPIFYAVIENDLRRVLAYSMINQLGFMVVGIGVGTELGVNGAVAHAFNDVFFKGLLFMSMGAVLHRTGTVNGSDLGGLYKSMPKTTLLCIVGAATISGFPLTSGFVSKSMIMKAAADAHYDVAWFLLLFAAAGVFHHAGIKIPFFAFFAHDSGRRVEEAPANMLVAMGLSAGACLLLGCVPSLLFTLLPHPVGDFQPFDAFHVIAQLQLLFFAALAFTALMLTRIYPPELRSVNLDMDWLVRRPARALSRFATGPLARGFRGAQGWMQATVARGWSAIFSRAAARSVSLRPLEVSVLLVVLTLLLVLLVEFLGG